MKIIKAIPKSEYTKHIFVIHMMYQKMTNKPSNSDIKRKLKNHSVDTRFHAIIDVERVKLKDNSVNKSVSH